MIEGFHGVPYDAPIARTREIIEICRQVWRRERLEYQGKHYTIPLPAGQGTGLGKPLKIINQPVQKRIPILLAALGPKNVELAAEAAEGWQPIFYLPEKAHDVWGQALAAGRAKRDPALGELDVYAGPVLAIGDNVESLREFVKPHLALYIGGWVPRARTSTTCWRPDMATEPRRTESSSCTWPGTRTAPPRLSQTSWCETST
ncbi:luciferase-like monooxygenase family protein [Mycobacterium ulcerans str. Harvey]|uniref:Luciferase-like monooxygenase family protein n=1 Tax=Mycobacterium ulcerans str. Harvey TaxID=1299332 RepID=A0ABP3A6S6_MYCUL|nr:luciferase-like monooxygenase family protein [Mycobacterium ulcerans str. Harvey]